VIIGDAPIQLCRFGELVPSDWRQKLKRRTGVPVEFVDFRRHVAVDGNLKAGVEEDARPADRFVLFDLGTESLLDPLTLSEGRFRVTNYNPDGLSKTHRRGVHQFLLCKEAFEADVLISLPKLKTHGKAGMTAALKNIVGLNGNKDFLPHHRVGGAANGGDCYPGLAPLKRLAEFYRDQANRRINRPDYIVWHRRAEHLLGWHRKFGNPEMEGSWYGNDTTWRMVLDLNRILLYGQLDGSLAETAQRKIYSFTDAVTAGQAQGPLAPEPLELGVVTFAVSSSIADVVHAGLLGLDYARLPLVRGAFGDYCYGLTKIRPEQCIVRVGERELSLEESANCFGIPARLPRGWAGHVERKATRDQLVTTGELKS